MEDPEANEVKRSLVDDDDDEMHPVCCNTFDSDENNPTFPPSFHTAGKRWRASNSRAGQQGAAR